VPKAQVAVAVERGPRLPRNQQFDAAVGTRAVQRHLYLVIDHLAEDALSPAHN
jgi:hypothetical protein